MFCLSQSLHRLKRARAAGAVARARRLSDRQKHQQAFELFVRAAHAGDALAQFHLGRCYLLALGVPPSLNQALRWLSQAAGAGEAQAQTQLAELALQGVREEPSADLFAKFEPAGQEPLWDRAEYWTTLAAASGSAEAKALLAFIRSEGPVEQRDYAAAEALYRESAEAGWSRGQLGLAMLLLRDADPARTAEAVEQLEVSAKAGMAASHFILGTLAETGGSGAVDLTEAAERYRIAAEMGHHPAQTRYGYALLYGRGVLADSFAAETWLRRAAVAGESQAAASLGFLYLHDSGLRRDPAEAALWLEQAAERGNAAAMRALGRLLLRSRADWPRALNWLGKAANAGDQGARDDLVTLVTPVPEA